MNQNNQFLLNMADMAQNDKGRKLQVKHFFTSSYNSIEISFFVHFTLKIRRIRIGTNIYYM